MSRTKRATTGLLALLTLVVAMLGGGASPVSAHSGETSYLYLDVTETSLSGRVEFPFGDVREAIGLELNGDPATIEAELEASLAELSEFAGRHLAISTNGQNWPIIFTEVERLDVEVAEDPDFGYAVVHFDTEEPVEEIPRQFEVTFDPFFDEVSDERDALLLIGNDWSSGVVENYEESLLRYTPDNRTQTVDLDDASWVKNFTASIALGLDHIKTGPDHILFVLVLLLPSVLVFNSGWKPAPSFGSSLWRVLKVVTMFTIAHTITFTLAGMDILPLPGPRFTETVIALSIAAAALHNLRPVVRNQEWIISFAFGLFHGMGFASLVSGLDVSRSTQLVSLLGRNVGIEIGQALVVLMTFPALFLLRRTRFYQPLFIMSSLGLVLISLGWMVERLFDGPEFTSTLVAGLFAFPRIYYVVAILTALAAITFVVERNSNRLLDVSQPDGEPSPDREPVFS